MTKLFTIGVIITALSFFAVDAEAQMSLSKEEKKELKKELKDFKTNLYGYKQYKKEVEQDKDLITEQDYIIDNLKRQLRELQALLDFKDSSLTVMEENQMTLTDDMTEFPDGKVYQIQIGTLPGF